MSERHERSLAETPTWAVATVITIMVIIGFLIHGALSKSGKWLARTKRKYLLLALEKIKEELMVFALLSLLMGHWIVFVAKICVKSSALSSRFYPCPPPPPIEYVEHRDFMNNRVLLRSHHLMNSTIVRLRLEEEHHDSCPKDHQPFVSYESLEQLQRFLLVLGVTHVFYSIVAIALAMIKIYSWRTWENHAKTMAFRGLLAAEMHADSENVGSDHAHMGRLSSFINRRTSHPWIQHRVLVWLICFSRQFWSSIRQADYMSLRLGFITAHELPFTYDFHNYMLRSMEEEFRDIVGISIPLWIFAIICIVLGFHGTNIYFWMSFLPIILILLVGTKLHHIVVKLAVEILDSRRWTGFEQFNLRDELFWFGNPRLLLRLIQFISFQNAYEMGMYIWAMWEIREASCYDHNRALLITRLTFGVVSQFWCSFITFPLYVIIAQMGSKLKKTIVSENVRKSLHGWRRKVRNKQDGPAFTLLTVPSSVSSANSRLGEENSVRFGGGRVLNQSISSKQPQRNERDQIRSATQDENRDEEIKAIDDVNDHFIRRPKGW